MKRFLAVLSMMLVGTTLMFAQSSRGVVSGIVTDPNGAVIPGAEITLTSNDTKVSRTTITNGEGFYRFDAVDLGTYSVAASAASFGKTTKSGISVTANQIASVDLALKLGSQEVMIEVSADSGALLQSESAVRGGNISTRQIVELPVLSGNPVSLALTLPGVSSNRSGVGVGSFSVNGARSRSNNFLIDGTENNDISVAGQGFQITNQDAVQEVSVQTANYDSEYGRAGGAVVNTITRSGTNEFHGTLAFEYDSTADDAITAAQSRNPVIIARGRPLSATTIVPSATLGGPLFLPYFGENSRIFDTRRDKHFFFVAYEENRFRQPGGSQTLQVPTAAGRAKLQQFAATNPNVALYLAATANTIAQTANLTSISLDNTNLPADQQTRGVVERGDFFRQFSTRFTGKQFQIRTDHRLTGSDQLSFRLLSDVQDQPLGGNVAFEGFDADYAADYKNVLLAETHIFSPTLTNELRLAYNLIRFGFPLSDPDGPAGTQPTLSFTGFSALGAAGNMPQGRTANNYQVQDTVTKIAGSHTIRGGVDYLRQISTQIAPANIRGSITYGAGGGYTALGNFVDNFGGGGSTQKFFGSQTYFPSLHRIAAFVQDRWNATASLTLTAGIRYEYFGTPFNSLRTPAFTGLFNVDPVTRTGPYSEPNQVQRDTNNFAPSVGLTWAPSFAKGIGNFLFGEKKSVLRLGYNMGYDSFFNNIASNAAASSPNGVIAQFNSTVTTANPRGQANHSAFLPTSAIAISPLSAQTLIVRDLVNPYYQRWSFGLQRELLAGMVMDVSYVGSKGTKLYINEDWNPQVRPELRITPINPATGQPVTTGLSSRLDNIQGARTVRTNGGSSTYHGGQLEVRRRFANNFQVTGAYTFSKLISNADEVFVTGFGNTGTSFFSLPAVLGGGPDDRALSEFDRTHRATFTYILESPFFRAQNGFAGKILGGWQVAGVTTFESGVPYTIFNGFDSDGIAGADRPNHNPNGKRGVRAIPLVDTNNLITGYINPEVIIGTTAGGTPIYASINPNEAEFIVLPAFVNGASGSIARRGSLGRNTERTRGINSTSLSFLKRTRLNETIYIDAKAEMFNAFNTPQFGSGNNQANELSQGLFLQPVNPTTSGGGRTIRYQMKFVF